MVLNLPLPSTVQTPALSVLWRKAFCHSHSQKFGNKCQIFSSAHYMNYDMLHNTLILTSETSRGQMPPDVIFNFLC